MHAPSVVGSAFVRQSCLHDSFATRAACTQAFFCPPQPAEHGSAALARSLIARIIPSDTTTSMAQSFFIATSVGLRTRARSNNHARQRPLGIREECDNKGMHRDCIDAR
jgi:hypothetical protein